MHSPSDSILSIVNPLHRTEPAVFFLDIHIRQVKVRLFRYLNAAAPFGSYEQAETLRLLFECKRNDKTGPIFVLWNGEEYPW